jgi:hypothetical protein
MDTPTKATLETALTQVLVAFGHGLGGLFVAPDAARTGMKRFSPVIERNLAEWDTTFLSVMAHATLIGRVSAHQATQRGSNVVTARDLLKALKLIDKERGRPGGRFVFCPFFHHRH